MALGFYDDDWTSVSTHQTDYYTGNDNLAGDMEQYNYNNPIDNSNINPLILIVGGWFLMRGF